MQYISLNDAIHAIASRIGLPEFLGDESRTYETAGEAQEFEQQYTSACRYSFAAAVLHQCLINSSPPARWWSMHPDTGMAIIGDSVYVEGFEILVRFGRIVRQEQENSIVSSLNYDGPFLGENGMPRRNLRTIDLDELGGRLGGLYWFQSVGLVTSELVKILDDNRISHNLSPQATTPSSAPEPQAAPAVAVVGASVVIHSTKARRDALTPVIEFAQQRCRNPQDTAEVWAALLVLAEKKHAPLRGATEDGLQYLKGGTAAFFNRDALRKRLDR